MRAWNACKNGRNLFVGFGVLQPPPQHSSYETMLALVVSKSQNG
jgi:hypothetical protein